MRHPLSTLDMVEGSCFGLGGLLASPFAPTRGVLGGPTEGSIAVGDVHGLAAQNTSLEAVPQHLKPPVAKRAKGSMVALSTRPLGVVELSCPAGPPERGESPPLNGISEESVARQSVGDHKLALSGPAGDRGLAGVTLQSVRCRELLRTVADLASDSSGKPVTQTWEAQIDISAGEAWPRGTFASSTDQQFAHATFPWAGTDLARESKLSQATVTAALAGKPIAAKSLALMAKALMRTPVIEVVDSLIMSEESDLGLA